MISMTNTIPITEDWLREIGFQWSEEPRLPAKRWLLWMGNATSDGRMNAREDLGIEVSKADDSLNPKWFCWIRADYCGRYSRFVHVRHIQFRSELIKLIEAMSGFPWDAANVYYGSLMKPEDAARLRETYEKRMEVELAKDWGKRVESETGADPSKREV